MNRYIKLMIGALVFLVACNDKSQSLVTAANQAIQVDSVPGQCPYLTKDPKGNTVLSWVRMLNDSSAVFCYAVSTDGKTFGQPVVIPHSHNIQPHGENLPKIIFKPSGEIIALWGAPSTNLTNKYAGMVFYAQSFDAGKNWSTPKPLTNDTASYDQRYYDVALLPTGEVGIIWLDNRKASNEEGSALYFASTNGKNGFQSERRIAESCCQCCRTDLFVDSKGGIHTLYRGIIKDSIRDMVHAVSTDGGRTFSSPKRISEDNWVLNGCPHTGPAMAETKDGLQFAWFTGGKDKGAYFTSSKDNGNSFSPRQAISPLGSHPQLAAMANGELVFVWDETATAGNKVFKRIGLQVRNADGQSVSDNYITADTATASFPVIATIKEKTSLIAYSQKIADNNFVFYQLFNVN
ncbi:sialidase family protein [Flavisolibacter tropicus]|nr:sialidase family protein [Flavisolibacter tropicus]